MEPTTTCHRATDHGESVRNWRVLQLERPGIRGTLVRGNLGAARLHTLTGGFPAEVRRKRMGTPRRIRASDQDRESTAEWLSEAHAVRRLSREELGGHAAAAYSAKTGEELHALTADLPVPAARTGLLSGIVAVRRVPRRASGRLSDIAIWNLLLVLAAGLIGLVSPVAVWVAAVLVPIPLLLSAALGISRQCRPRAGTRAGGQANSIRRNP